MWTALLRICLSVQGTAYNGQCVYSSHGHVQSRLARSCPNVNLCWPDRATLSVKDGLLLKESRLVIPSAMRNEVLTRLHKGHQGVVKCKARARQAVWWPGLCQQIMEMVLNCRTCIKDRQNVREPLMPTECPDRPWQGWARIYLTDQS